MRRIGPYELRDEIGRGGMGVVYRARDTRLGRDVAIKLMLDPERVAGAARERFVREALGAARISHPGVVPIFDAGLDGGQPFVVMAFVPGVTLKAASRSERLPARRVAEIVRQVAEAVHHGHRNGIIHRDLKPENVLIDDVGRPLVMDFGLAYDVGDQRSLTESGEIIGTPSYMSPEQASGEPARDPSTDVWALGAILYWGLTGRAPFVGQGPLEIIKRVLFDDPPAPRSIDPEVPIELEAIALRCLEKEPDRRPRSAATVADALGRFVRGEPVGHPFAVRGGGSSAVSSQGGRDTRPRRRRVSAAIVLGVVVVGSAVTGLIVVAGSSPPATDPPSAAAARGAIDVPRSGPPSPRIAEADAPAIAEEPDDRTRAAAFFASGVARMREGDFPAAAAVYQQALELDPGIVGAWIDLGAIRFEEGDLAAAGAAFDRAVELDPQLAKAWHHRAVFRFQGGDHRGAIADASAAIELDPASYESLIVRAAARARLGDHVGSAIDAGAAIDLDVYRVEGWLLRAKARASATEWSGAVADCSEVIARDASRASVWLLRARARGALGDHEGAAADARRAIELDPSDPGGLLVRSVARLRLGRRDGAIADARRAVELAPESPKTWVGLGLALLETSPEEAAANLRRALELDPDPQLETVARGALARASVVTGK